MKITGKAITIFIALVHIMQCYSATLFIETKFEPKYNYDHILHLIQNAGYTQPLIVIPHYKLAIQDLQQYDTIFIALDFHFFINTYLRSSLIRNTIQKLASFVSQSDKTLLVLVPQMKNNQRAVDALKQFLYYFDISYNPVQWRMRQKTNSLWHFFTNQPDYPALISDVLDMNLSNVLFSGKRIYTTSLLYANEPIGDINSHTCTSLTNDVIDVECCGKKNDVLSICALNITKHNNNSRIILIPMNQLSFTELEENFRVNPRNQLLQQRMLTNAYETLHAFAPAPSKKIDVRKLYQNKTKPQSPRKIIVGWIDIEPFMQNSAKLEQGINYLINAHLTILWITLNPEKILSKRAIEPQQKEWLAKTVYQFTQALKDACIKHGFSCPALFVNFDLTTNFLKKPVAHYTIDAYGTKFSKIPSPLDWDELWKAEVIDVFDAFYALWNKESQLPLGGIFFDFEMYHAQDQLTEYPNSTDYSDVSWHQFVNEQKDPRLKKLHTTPARLNWLIKNNLVDSYMQFHYKEAKKIGQKIREHIKNYNNQLQIGVYIPTLAHTYLMQGLLAGLSTKTEPIILATFNNKAYVHAPYLQKLGIYAYYLPVMLLSQLRSADDFDVIQTLITQNDGIWFNKISRLLETFTPDVWWELETSPLEPEYLTQEMGKHIKLSICLE